MVVPPWGSWLPRQSTVSEHAGVVPVERLTGVGVAEPVAMAAKRAVRARVSCIAVERKLAGWL